MPNIDVCDILYLGEKCMSQNTKDMMDIITNYRTKDGKSFDEQLQYEVKSILLDCQKYAPHYFTDEFIKKYLEIYPNILKKDIESGEFDLEPFELEKPNGVEDLIASVIKEREHSCCHTFSNNIFQSLGKGNRNKGQEIFNNYFLSNSSNYNKYYKNCTEFRQFYDSMSDENKNYFKKLRNWDTSGLTSFYKWVYIIAFFYISVPYLLIKRLAMKYKKIPTPNEYMNSDEVKEIFTILTKGEIYS